MSNQNPLVIVVGAGASKEVDLPISSQLKVQIASALDIRYDEFGVQKVSGDNLIKQVFDILAKSRDGPQGTINPYLHASWMIRDNMPQAASIDNFINNHKDNPNIAMCGKLAIARCILEAEKRSFMRVDRSNINNKIDFVKLEPTWYNLFFRLIVDDCQLQDIPKRLSRIAIITFNYDRCIEHYLHGSFMNYYGIEVQEAADLLNNLRIFHPYGSLGPLPWAGRANAIDFGATPNPSKLLSIAGELKTFTEGTDAHSEIGIIRSTLQSAGRVAFLGFAFNRQNLELLYSSVINNVPKRNIPVYGTTCDISESNVQVIADELNGLAGYMRDGLRLKGLTCAALLKEYSRSLSIR